MQRVEIDACTGVTECHTGTDLVVVFAGDYVQVGKIFPQQPEKQPTLIAAYLKPWRVKIVNEVGDEVNVPPG